MPIKELDDIPEIKVKTVYNGGIMVTYINPNLTYEQLRQEMRGICRFPPDQVFTMKWVDEEGDPCIISTQNELETAIRLFELNKEPEITIHGALIIHSWSHMRPLQFTTSTDAAKVDYYGHENPS